MLSFLLNCSGAAEWNPALGLISELSVRIEVKRRRRCLCQCVSHHPIHRGQPPPAPHLGVCHAMGRCFGVSHSLLRSVDPLWSCPSFSSPFSSLLYFLSWQCSILCKQSCDQSPLLHFLSNSVMQSDSAGASL